MSKLQAKNEAIINVPIATIWSIITDITLLPKINPGVVKASGSMDQLQDTRTCEINNKRFCFILEKLSDSSTKVVNETYYDPANVVARIMNGLMIKKMISRAQAQILGNIRSLTENH